MENKICVYAICKNEEQFVEKWVKSMSEADKIVVLDTGSTDHTVDKLKELGVEVKVQVVNPWRFDVARNLSLEMVPDDCNICVCTDLDEVLEPGWAKPLREKWIEGKHERGLYMYSWSHLPNGESGRKFIYDKVHSKNWHWRAPVHELLVDNINNSNKYSHENVLDLTKEMHLHHYPDKSKSRGSYLPLLELRKQEMEDDYYGLIYLAHEYYYRGFYDKSIIVLEHTIRLINSKKDEYTTLELASCYLFLGDNLTAQSKYFDAIAAYSKAIYIEPTYREPYLGIANSYMQLARYDIALIYLKECKQKSFRHYTWLERDTSWSYDLDLSLAISSYYSGDRKAALVYILKALNYDNKNEMLQKNFKVIMKGIDEEERMELHGKDNIENA
jgi:tetratricopeptide (TPR) repeat protein